MMGNTFLRKHPALHAWLQRINTRLALTKAQQYALDVTDDIPRMSTRAVGALLLHLVAKMPPQSMYLNVGVWHGFSLLCPAAGYPDRACIGVDNFSEFGSPRSEFLERWEKIRSHHHAFYDMGYEEYFSSYHKGPIGAYFYDGSHEYVDQRRALELAEPFFVSGTFLIVDDTNWSSARRATEDFIANSTRSYVRLLDIRTAGNGHPTFWNGLMIFCCCSESQAQQSTMCCTST